MRKVSHMCTAKRYKEYILRITRREKEKENDSDQDFHASSKGSC